MNKGNKDKKNEPFPPEQTPNPPQVVDPNIRNERNEPNAPVEDEKKRNPSAEDQKQQGSGKKLGDPIEIDDETTI